MFPPALDIRHRLYLRFLPPAYPAGGNSVPLKTAKDIHFGGNVNPLLFQV
jgi:hypothetical protein